MPEEIQIPKPENPIHEEGMSTGAKIGIIVIIIIVIVALMAIFIRSGYMKKLSEQTSEKTTTEIVEIEKTITREEIKNFSYTVGQPAIIGNHKVTVFGISDYAPSVDEDMQPKSGYKFVKVDLEEEDIGKKSVRYGNFDYKLQDNQNFSYIDTITSIEHYFGGGILKPGQKKRGFMVFEIPINNMPAQLTYAPNWLENAQIFFKLQ